MTFAPIIPSNGYSGWRFLQKTLTSQKKALQNTLPEKRKTTYFQSNFNNVKTASDLVDDPRLLEVALSAFGLQDDINNKFFIKKILKDGIDLPNALANRLSDKRYYAFAKSFNLALEEKKGIISETFINNTLSRYEANNKLKGFETSIQEVEYFKENMPNVRSVESLVNDRRLLTIVLGSYGLEQDINHKSFIKKVIKDGVVDAGAVSNLLTNKKYYTLSKAFNNEPLEPQNSKKTTYISTVLQKYHNKRFEAIIGEKDNNLRLALNVNESLNNVINSSNSINAQWYGVLGDPPLKKVFETAFGLPSQFGRIDLDKQLKTMKEHAQKTFGSIKLPVIISEINQEKLIRLFLVRSDVSHSNTLAESRIKLSSLNSLR